MPVYDYKCPHCGTRVNDVFVHSYKKKVRCKQCKSNMSKLIPTRVHADVFPVNYIHLEHVSPEGKTFKNKGDMRRYAREKNLELGALL